MVCESVPLDVDHLVGYLISEGAGEEVTHRDY